MQPQKRLVNKILKPQIVTDGAGVKIKRLIGTPELDYLDPFLLLDNFGSDNPDEFMAGFPWHPHRGIETVTYMLNGKVDHRDSLGNAGTIGPSDVQWMTAGKGIIHEEMPKPIANKMSGFQLWVNLPAKFKMMRPRYQEILADQIPEIKQTNGAFIKVIAGNFENTTGPVKDIVADPLYLDITLTKHCSFSQPIQIEHNAFAFIFEGEAIVDFSTKRESQSILNPALIVFGKGDLIEIKTEEKQTRFLLITGKPIKEPMVRYGPFVMNTREEIIQAYRDYENGTFI
jgi:redox-sensitive bicupin YhaK (pirin superfamily)